MDIPWSTDQSLFKRLPYLASVPGACAARRCLEIPPELPWWEELMFCLCH